MSSKKKKHQEILINNAHLINMPISLFSIIMGLTGLALAWNKAHQIIATPILVSEIIRVFASLLFIILLIAYGLKALLFPKAVRSELAHPIRINFFATVSIGLLLLSTAWFPDIPKIALIVWISGVALHLFISLKIISSWIYHAHYEVKHVNPAWFMPAVGNIIVPIMGVKVAPIELSWFFFSIGIVFWLVLLTIVLNRMFFYEPLPTRLMPLLFILLAPPAVGFMSWTNIIGKLDAFANILYYTSLFIALILANNIRRFLQIPFFISTWAYSFPLAALTIATLQMAKFSGLLCFFWLGTCLLYLVTIVVVLLIVRTIIAVWHGELCVPEHEQSFK